MQWYEKLFENYAEQYDKESFTQGTIGECDFIERSSTTTSRSGLLTLAAGLAGIQ